MVMTSRFVQITKLNVALPKVSFFQLCIKFYGPLSSYDKIDNSVSPFLL